MSYSYNNNIIFFYKRTFSYVLFFVNLPNFSFHSSIRYFQVTLLHRTRSISEFNAACDGSGRSFLSKSQSLSKGSGETTATCTGVETVFSVGRHTLPAPADVMFSVCPVTSYELLDRQHVQTIFQEFRWVFFSFCFIVLLDFRRQPAAPLVTARTRRRSIPGYRKSN